MYTIHPLLPVFIMVLWSVTWDKEARRTWMWLVAISEIVIYIFYFALHLKTYTTPWGEYSIKMRWSSNSNSSSRSSKQSSGLTTTTTIYHHHSQTEEYEYVKRFFCVMGKMLSLHVTRNFRLIVVICWASDAENTCARQYLIFIRCVTRSKEILYK